MSMKYWSDNPSEYDGLLIRENYQLKNALKWCIDQLERAAICESSAAYTDEINKIKLLIKFDV